MIDKAYLGDADFQIKRAKERLGTGNNRLAQQSGLWALEQVAYAKRRLERHAPKIEGAAGIFFERTSESTRKELRENYARVRENYANTEDRLDALAEALKRAGMPILSETLENVRRSSGDDAIKAVNDGLRRAGESGKGDVHGNETVTGGTGAALGGANGGSAAGGGAAEQTNAQGVRFVQTADGVMMIPPGTVIRGARLNPDGTITFADGSTTSINNVKAGPGGAIQVVNPATGATATIDPATGLPGAAGGSGGARGAGGFDPSSFNGRLPPGVVVLDQNGNRITIDAEFQNGEQTGVKKDYIGGAGATLVSETKVSRKLVQATGSEWRVNVVPGESRSWNFSIRMGEQRSSNGVVTLTMTVDGGGSSGFRLNSWEIVDEKGNRAAVAPSSQNPAEAVATFSKGGEYTFTVSGETDWGSPFRVKGQGGVYP